ncbi:keratin-associated protein 24-1 [Nycticebus coucang]|uniref:keratin-associated protein 24-1 n=1 Tax=Nycticebus coucang TaxID=9470 RepID=UPI00234DE8A7|nr:keratin-associated protein 24-1 [Nycticebus coucang]
MLSLPLKPAVGCITHAVSPISFKHGNQNRRQRCGGSMSVLRHPRVYNAASCRTHCSIPVTPSDTACPNDGSPTYGHCLPSSYQGNLWLLDYCQESYCEAPTCESSCEPNSCTTSCDPSDSCVPCNSPSEGQASSVCETTNVGPNCSRCSQTRGYVSGCTRTGCASKACQTLSNGSNRFGQLNSSPKCIQSLSRCRLGGLEYRSYQNLGFMPTSFPASCYIAGSCQRQSYLMRDCQYASYRPMRCRPLGYLYRSFRSLSCIPSTFPPLRYLCSSNRTLTCY